MNRIYLFIAALAISGSVFAQRSADIAVSHYFVNGSTAVLVKDNDKIFANGGTEGPKPQYTFRRYFKCVSTNANDTLIATDTIKLKSKGLFGTTTSLNLFNVNGIGKGDSVFFDLGPASLTPPQSQTTSGVSTVQWCDSIWVTDVNKALITDPTLSNNEKCNALEITAWVAGIENVPALPGALALYPNPATQTLNMKYNFVTPASSATIIINDATGKMVHRQDLGTNLSGSKDFPLNISNLGSGLYFIQLTTSEGKSAANKFVIQ